jgi:hypothetical protein
MSAIEEVILIIVIVGLGSITVISDGVPGTNSGPIAVTV